jgi:hypothetical protein
MTLRPNFQAAIAAGKNLPMAAQDKTNSKFDMIPCPVSPSPGASARDIFAPVWYWLVTLGRY